MLNVTLTDRLDVRIVLNVTLTGRMDMKAVLNVMFMIHQSGVRVKCHAHSRYIRGGTVGW